jgi:transcriptional regulator with XRE-family HTH domain
MTVNQLAIYSGVSAASISRYENGERGTPKPPTLEKLAKGLRVDYTELMKIAGHIKNQDDPSNNPDDDLLDIEELLRDPTLTVGGKPLSKQLRDDLLAYVRIQKAMDKCRVQNCSLFGGTVDSDSRI